jgi:hypothetical protein
MSGTDDPTNLAMVESRMNSQLGAMFRGQLKELDPETIIKKVSIKGGGAKSTKKRESGDARSLQNLLLKYSKKLKIPVASIKNWFKLD